MQAGRLDRLITLQTGTPAQDDAGQPIVVWTDLARVWAERRAIGGGERFAGQQLVADVDTRFVVRYRDDISPRETLRILGDDGRYYDIVRVDEIGRSEGLNISAKARAE